MTRRRVVAGLVILALIAALTIGLWPRGPTEEGQRNMRLARADRTILVGMTRGEVEQLLQCPPDERLADGSVERWTTRGHFGHTVTVWYEGGKVSRVEGRTWRSKPDPSIWDDVRHRLGL
jgi:hypothetical protein